MHKGGCNPLGDLGWMPSEMNLSPKARRNLGAVAYPYVAMADSQRLVEAPRIVKSDCVELRSEVHKCILNAIL